MRWFALLLLVPVLSGCWQMKTRPYRDVPGVTVFAPGSVTMTGPGNKQQHYRLARQPKGRYRLTSVDKGSDFGEGFDLGFFPLPGAPSKVLIYQAVPLDHPRDDMLRYYGLVVITGPGSADEMRPDCDKDGAAARASGTRKGGDGACTFATRAALEQSLLALWKRGRKPEYRYTMR